ncbi:MAG: NADH-quinone oxidoreductase subunit NuoE [Firmicutes bacterium]|nr:NADH-quinone oxidoreductase subunit NuoE [Bacillota bacterium]
MLSIKQKDDIRKKAKEFPGHRSVSLPALYIAQSGKGYIDRKDIEEIAGILSISYAELYGIASFYNLIHRKPIGKFHIQVCTNISCSLLGAEHLLTRLEKKLGIREGGATADGIFSLESVECLGSCDKAPVMMINEKFHEALTEKKLSRILASLKEKAE